MSALAANRWPTEREDALRRMHAEKKTMSAMALALGGGLTRNAVIGKCHRLGLKCTDRPSPPKPASMATARRPAHKPRPAPLPVTVAPPRERGLPLFCRETACHAVAPLPLKIGLLALGAAQCRYPVEDRAYCGHATGGGTYCPHHARLCYRPSKPRRAA